MFIIVYWRRVCEKKKFFFCWKKIKWEKNSFFFGYYLLFCRNYRLMEDNHRHSNNSISFGVYICCSRAQWIRVRASHTKPFLHGESIFRLFHYFFFLLLMEKKKEILLLLTVLFLSENYLQYSINERNFSLLNEIC